MDMETIRGRLLKDLADLKSQILTRKAGEHGTAISGEKEPCDIVAVNISTQMIFALTAAKQKKVRRIEEVLDQIQKGTFGICGDCREPISEKRLNFDPTVRQCLTCKEQEEALNAQAGTRKRTDRFGERQVSMKL